MKDELSKPNTQPRFIISGGGTGGHIFPAVSIADALRRRYPQCEILFVGAEGRMEMERVPRAGYEIVGLPVRGIDRKNLLSNYKVGIALFRSMRLANKTIRNFRPDVVIGVGGYASGPILSKAHSLGIPTLVQEQNSYAGVTNKLLSRGTEKICVAYPEMERFFPAEKLVFTGNPIRPEIEFGRPERAEALRHFGFDQNEHPVVLVVGGSLGALTINKSITDKLGKWAESGVRLIWQTGKNYIETAKKAVEEHPSLKCYVNDFITRMDYAYSAADLVVSRAGACSISELCLLGKPTILVPSPNVAEDHQTKNALALSTRDAAVMIPDAKAGELLVDTALSLVRNPEELRALSEQIRTLAKPQAADRIVDEIVKLVQKRKA